jgi:hypothetical protein
MGDDERAAVAGPEGLKVPGEIAPQLTSNDADLPAKGAAIHLGGFRASELNSIILPESHSLVYGQILRQGQFDFGGTIQAQYTAGMMSCGLMVTMTLDRNQLTDVCGQLGWGLAAIDVITLNLGQVITYQPESLIVRYMQEGGDSHKTNALLYSGGPVIDGDFTGWPQNPTATVFIWYPGETLNSKAVPPYDTNFFGGSSSVVSVKFRTKGEFLSGNGVAALTRFLDVSVQEFYLDFKHDSSKIMMNMPGPSLPYHDIVTHVPTGNRWTPAGDGSHTVTFNAFETVGLEYMYLMIRKVQNLQNATANNITVTPFAFVPLADIRVRLGSNIVYEAPGFTSPQAIAAKMSDGDYRIVTTALNGPHASGPFVLKPEVHWLTVLPRSLVQELANPSIKTNVVSAFPTQMEIRFRTNVFGVQVEHDAQLVLQYRKALIKDRGAVRIV